jgi:hypothetical protein
MEIPASPQVLVPHLRQAAVLVAKLQLAAVAVLEVEVVVLTLRVQETRLRLHLRKAIMVASVRAATPKIIGLAVAVAVQVASVETQLALHQSLAPEITQLLELLQVARVEVDYQIT